MLVTTQLHLVRSISSLAEGSSDIGVIRIRILPEFPCKALSLLPVWQQMGDQELLLDLLGQCMVCKVIELGYEDAVLLIFLLLVDLLHDI